MGFSRYYKEELKFLITVVTGEVNNESLMQHIKDTNEEILITDLRELADLRNMTDFDMLTMRGVLDSAMTQDSREHGQLAFLLPDNQLLYGITRAFQTLSDDKLGEVKIFDNLDEALSWLANDDTDLNHLKQYVQRSRNITASNVETTGSCNCGKVTFAISEQLTDVYVCHCSICRKSTGSSGIAVAVVANTAFSWLSGEEHIRAWKKPNHDWAKNFCSECGSPLPDKNDDKQVYIPVSLLDSGTQDLSIKHHMFVGSKAPWDEIGNTGKQHDEGITG